MSGSSNWGDLRLRLISGLFLLFASSLCIYLGGYFLHYLSNACWSNALGIGKNVISISKQTWFSAVLSIIATFIF